MHYKKFKKILSNNNGVNLYRGCTHGCIYCDSRSKCYNFDHEFEDILIKENVIPQLEQELKQKRKKCVIGTGAMTDPYIPLERNLKITRQMLELCKKYKMGVAIQTKSNLILRDIDLIDEINKQSKAVVQITLTTFDEELCKKIEPNVCSTKERFAILKECQKRNIPTVVWLCPFLPYINDTKENLLGILNYCLDANVKGIIFFGIGLTLREGNREYYYQNLEKLFPTLKEKYIKEYGNAYSVVSKNNDSLIKIFYDFCKQNNIETNISKIFEYMKTYEEKNEFEQLQLFPDSKQIKKYR